MITLKRIIKLGLVNFWRNRWLSLAASLMIMLTLVTMGGFALLNIFANATAEGIKERIDLSVYFYDTASDEQIQELQYTLSNRSDVKNIRLISKDQALVIWQQRAINSKIKQLITADENPLPRSLQIKAAYPEALGAIAAAISTDQYKPLIRSLSYEETKAAIDKLIRLTHFIRRLGLGLTIFLLAISLVVILNTIRLTIFTRRDEIEVMRLVGANNAFIRVPFGVEAVLYGLIGGLLAYLIVSLAMAYFGTRLASYFADVAAATHTPYAYLIQPYFDSVSLGHTISFPESFIQLWQLGLLQILIGVIFSLFCSLIALRRYLRL